MIICDVTFVNSNSNNNSTKMSQIESLFLILAFKYDIIFGSISLWVLR